MRRILLALGALILAAPPAVADKGVDDLAANQECKTHGQIEKIAHGVGNFIQMSGDGRRITVAGASYIWTGRCWLIERLAK